MISSIYIYKLFFLSLILSFVQSFSPFVDFQILNLHSLLRLDTC
ncbi:hypothetical protein V6Z11_A03G127200 [Gossypium hirsutum]